MMRRTRLALGLALAVGLPAAAPAAAQGVDPLEVRLLAPLAPMLRWDNVEGAPYWRDGVAPEGWLGRADADGRLHTILLQPGERTRLVLPGRALLRLRRLDAALQPGAVRVTRSLGDGVAVEADLVPHGDGALVALPQGDAPTAFSVTRPDDAEGPARLALFVSRLETPPMPELHRRRIDLPIPDVRLTRPDDLRATAYDPLEADAPLSVTLEGPLRLAIESRLLLEDRPDWHRAYELELSLDGASWRRFALEAGPDLRDAPRIAGKPEIGLASPRRVIANLPEGRHELAILTSAAAYLRITAYDGEAFLLPGLNAPQGLSEGVLDTPHMAGLSGSGLPEGFNLDRLENLLAAPGGVLGAADLAEAVARDNRYDGGLLGAAIADRAAAAAPSLDALDALAGRLRGARGVHRDLLPDGAMAATPARAWTAPVRLRDPLDPSRNTIPDTIPRSALLGQLVEGLFVPLDGRLRRYAVPPRPAPTTLRLLVAHDGEGPRELAVRVGEGPMRRIIVGDAPPLPPELFEPSAGAVGLARLGPQAGPDGTRSGLFAQQARPGPTLVAGVVTLPLPPDAESVTISGPNDGGPLRIALQYRAAKPWALGDGIYERALDMLGRDAAPELFERAVRAAVECAEPPAACAAPGTQAPAPGAELRNDWIPLLRLLRARHDVVFAASAEGLPPLPPREPSMSAGAARPMLDHADRLMAVGDPITALELYAHVVRSAAGGVWQRAVIGQARALTAAGEGHLARRILAALALQRSQPSLAARALSQLETEARAEGDAAALIGIAAARIVASGGRAAARDLSSLASHLAAEGRDAMALQVGLLVPPASRGRDLSRTLAQTAYRARWPRTFERLVESLDPEQAALWRGLAAQRFGDADTALARFKAAGASGARWREALGEGARLAYRLEEAGADQHTAAEWLDWYARHPGPRISEDAFEAFTGHAGTLSLTSRVRDLPFRAVVAEPGRAAELTVAGPATLTLEIRPLHAGPASRIDGWVSVEAAGERIDVPVTANGVSPGLDIVGETRRLGVAVRETLLLPPGSHAIRIAPAGFDIAVRAEIARPALPLSPLPPPTPEIAAQAGGAAEGLAADGETTALRRLATLLRRLEARPQAGGALAEAARLAKALGITPRGRRLGDRLARITRWEPFRSVASSAGLRTLPVAAWAPESPALRARTALFGPLGEREELLFGDATLALALLEPEPTELRARVALAVPPTYETPAVTIRYRLDDGDWRRITLDAGRPEAVLEISVPAGDHAVRFALESPPPNAFVRLDLSEAGADSASAALEQPERAWDVATREEPVVVLVEGPAWLRIDSESGGATTNTYRSVAAGWQEVEIRPEDNAQERLVRVFRLVRDETARTPPPLPLRHTPATPEAPFVLPWLGVPSILAVADELPPGGHEDGTWSFNLGAERRLPSEESGAGGEADSFTQLSVIHRFRHPAQDLRLRTEALARLRTHEGPTLGLLERIDYVLPDTPLRFSGSLGFHVQDLRGRSAAWSLDGQASALLPHDLNERTTGLANLGLFARHQSLSGPGVPSDVDSDVFNSYRNDHPHGLRFGYTVTHRPWHDTELSAGLSYVTNESFSPVDPERLSLAVGIRQLAGPVVVEAGYRRTEYFDDDDRDGGVSTDLVDLSAEWERWTDRGRLSLDGRVGWRIDREEAIGLISFTWHFGAARGYDDFRPGETPFRNLRELRRLERIGAR